MKVKVYCPASVNEALRFALAVMVRHGPARGFPCKLLKAAAACAGFALLRYRKRRREAGPLAKGAKAGQKGTPSEGILSGGSGASGGGSAGSTPTQRAGPGSPGQLEIAAGRPTYYPPNLLFDDASGGAFPHARGGGRADPDRVAAMVAAVKADAQQRSLSRRLPSSHPLDDDEDKPGEFAVFLERRAWEVLHVLVKVGMQQVSRSATPCEAGKCSDPDCRQCVKHLCFPEPPYT